MTGPWTNPGRNQDHSGTLRRDSASDDDEDSTPTQVEHTRAFCEETGITPGEAYVDRDGSRTGFKQLMEDATGENHPSRG